MPKEQADTAKFVDIQDIKEDVVLMKDGSLRGVLEVDAINFELKSQEEQNAIIIRFQDFLNSLDFSVQISVISRKMDLKQYLKTIEDQAGKITNDLLRLQAIEYGRFINGLLELANIMSKRFYVVVPFYLMERKTGSTGILGSIKGIAKPSATVSQMTPEDFATYKTQLDQRLEFVNGGLSSMSVTARKLGTQELANLYYKLYNPEAQETITI